LAGVLLQSADYLVEVNREAKNFQGDDALEVCVAAWESGAVK
jgi:hypothetical protein